jgi:hypothetical protein
VSPPSSSALCGHPHRCAAISSTATPSPSLWEPGTTRHRHPRHCTPSGLPSATPSSRRTDGDSSGKHPRTHPRSRFWASIGLATTPAGSEIRRDDQQLHNIVHHTAICRLELCGTIVNRLPLGLEKEESVPWPRGGGRRRIVAHSHFPAFTMILALCLNQTSRTWRPLLLSRHACSPPHYGATQYSD